VLNDSWTGWMTSGSLAHDRFLLSRAQLSQEAAPPDDFGHQSSSRSSTMGGLLGLPMVMRNGLGRRRWSECTCPEWAGPVREVPDRLYGSSATDSCDE
jgi:hypothetical protein